MKRFFRRVIYLAVILVWLVIMAFPVVALVLATQQQIEIGQDANNHVRLFLLQDSDIQGIGIEWARPLRNAPSCTQTSVNYFMWEGEPEPVSFCQCFDPLTGELVPDSFSACTE